MCCQHEIVQQRPHWFVRNTLSKTRNSCCDVLGLLLNVEGPTWMAEWWKLCFNMQVYQASLCVALICSSCSSFSAEDKKSDRPSSKNKAGDCQHQGQRKRLSRKQVNTAMSEAPQKKDLQRAGESAKVGNKVMPAAFIYGVSLK